MATELVADLERYHLITEGRKRVDPVTFSRAFRKVTHFQELDADLVVIKDEIGFLKIMPDGTTESYMAKQAQERAKGKNEAVSYGRGTINNRRCIEVIFNWEFMAGTSGVVVGEKISRAMKLAAKENLPVIILYSSGGQRQQENVPALREMLRTTHAISQFKEKTNQPVISVLVGDVWGGLSASTVPMGEPVIGIAGTNFGFAGQSASGQQTPEGVFTAENSCLTTRGVQVVANDLLELMRYLGKYLSLFEKKDKLVKPEKKRETTGVDINRNGFVTPSRTPRTLRSHHREDMSVPWKLKNMETVYEQNKVHCLDARRPDLVYLTKYAFDIFVTFFSGWVTEKVTDRGVVKHLWYPGIVGGLGCIDDPRLEHRIFRVVFGNQPSYRREVNGNIVREPAQPTASDFRYALRMFDFAERFGHQITTIGDTPGAKPDLDPSTISECLQAQVKFPHFTSAYNIEVGGSGGWLGSVCVADYVAMYSGAQEYVAAPKAATGILYRNPNAPMELVKATAESLKPDAKFLFEHGLADRIIPEPENGAQNHPLAAVLAIREDIISRELEFGGLTKREILQRRAKRMGMQEATIIGHLDELKPRHPRLTAIKKLFRRH